MDVVVAQREAAELSMQKKQAQSELAQLQQQVAEASGVSHQVQGQLQAEQAEHAVLVADLRCVPVCCVSFHCQSLCTGPCT